MTRLIVSSAADPKAVSLDTADFAVIAGELAALERSDIGLDRGGIPESAWF